MKKYYINIEKLAEQEGFPVFQFCILCTGRVRASEKATFQTFLYMGEPDEKKNQQNEKLILYRWAYRAATDEALRKDSKPLSRKKMQEALGQELNDTLWTFLKKPVKEKAALFLTYQCGFSEEDAADILHISAARIKKYTSVSPAEEVKEALDQLSVFDPKTDWLDRLGDDVLLRYEERSVPFENKLLRLRSAIDRAVPYIAALVVLICIAAIWYTAKVNAALPVE